MNEFEKVSFAELSEGSDFYTQDGVHFLKVSKWHASRLFNVADMDEDELLGYGFLEHGETMEDFNPDDHADTVTDSVEIELDKDDVVLSPYL